MIGVSITKPQCKQTTQKGTPYLCVIGQGRFYDGLLGPDPIVTWQGLFPVTTVSAVLG
jgi:hypothetical protein